MRAYVVLRYIGTGLLLNAAFMFLSAMVSLVNDLDTGFYPLILSFIFTTIIGIFPFVFVSSEYTIRNKESFAIVIWSWAASCIVGMMPYVLWGGEFSIVNALFESVSGYTTTGSTILRDVEALPKGLLFWRSCTHLIGGAGIVLFSLAMIPLMSKSNVSLSKNAEMSSFAKDNYNYRMQKTIRIVLVVYVVLISAEAILLKFVGMSWFDAVTHSFSTIATGGFSTKNLSIAYYNNIWIEIVTIFFMCMAGLHFGLIFSSLSSKRNNIFRSEVSKFYIFTIIITTIAIAINLWATNTYSVTESVRYSAFQVTSIISTTGFATVDTAAWPPFSILILIFLMIQCACAGSTTGGIKSDRLLLLLKTFKTHILQLQHPNAIVKVKMNNITVSNDIIGSALIFITLYLLIIVVGTLILSAMGIDLMTSFSATASCLGNVGPGFAEVSSLSNYADMPQVAKIVCSLIMLMGRLELFGFLQIFIIKSWK